ncbi:hypothetical protein [Mesorhizobium sp.]|uniref:hypothetical protein n=1 Tax=Mesorhizobium sp. TaxID=1871066 RepID=UPI0011F615B3|nr:hypothetical protein [Mesorhizobium sp.]TIM37539.1 MAG: hypothetical protein E5Y56_33365 [Mesorhizobium sp.]
MTLVLASIPIALFTAGATAPVTVMGITASVAALTAIGTTAAVLTAVGGVITLADCILMGVKFHINPVAVANMYGPDGYNIEFSGAQVLGQLEPNTDPAAKPILNVTGFKPLHIWYTNNTSHAHHEADATA